MTILAAHELAHSAKGSKLRFPRPRPSRSPPRVLVLAAITSRAASMAPDLSVVEVSTPAQAQQVTQAHLPADFMETAGDRLANPATSHMRVPIRTPRASMTLVRQVYRPWWPLVARISQPAKFSEEAMFFTAQSSVGRHRLRARQQRGKGSLPRRLCVNTPRAWSDFTDLIMQPPRARLVTTWQKQKAVLQRPCCKALR